MSAKKFPEDYNKIQQELFWKHTHAELCNPEEVVYKKDDVYQLLRKMIDIVLDETADYLEMQPENIPHFKVDMLRWRNELNVIH